MKKTTICLGLGAFLVGAVLAAIPYVKDVVRTRPSFSNTELCINNVPLTVEVASNPWKRIWGLSMLDAPIHDGMLFTYLGEVKAGESSFWMYRTRMPLGLAFLDGEGTVVDTVRMLPCETEKAACRKYRSAEDYESAIEVPLFLFDMLHIEKGVTVANGQCDVHYEAGGALETASEEAE